MLVGLIVIPQPLERTFCFTEREPISKHVSHLQHVSAVVNCKPLNRLLATRRMPTLQDIALQCSANLLRITQIPGLAVGQNVHYPVVRCGFPKSLHSVLGNVRSCLCLSNEGIQSDNIGRTPLILNLCTRWKWVSRFSHFTSGTHTQHPLNRRLVGPQNRFRQFEE
jgi:hypothetical protein